jgi:hypothetical protein
MGMYVFCAQAFRARVSSFVGGVAALRAAGFQRNAEKETLVRTIGLFSSSAFLCEVYGKGPMIITKFFCVLRSFTVTKVV